MIIWLCHATEIGFSNYANFVLLFFLFSSAGTARLSICPIRIPSVPSVCVISFAFALALISAGSFSL